MLKIWVCTAIILLFHDETISHSFPRFLLILPLQPSDKQQELQSYIKNEEAPREDDRYIKELYNFSDCMKHVI